MNKKLKIILFSLIGAIVIVVYLFLNFKNKNSYLEESYNGVVKDLKYDSKGYPEIMIEEKESHGCLCNKYDFVIEIGDSISKKSGSHQIEVYRNGVLEIICGDTW